MAEENTEITVAPGDTVIFTGFTSTDDVPDNGELLAENESYVVDSINDGGPIEGTDEVAEASIFVVVDNPAFNSKKKPSEANQKQVLVQLYPDEFEAAEGEEGEGEEGEGEEIEVTAAKVGDFVRVSDDGGGVTYGTVMKKTRTALVIDPEDGNGKDHVEFSPKEITGLLLLPPQEEAVPAPESVAKPAAKAETKPDAVSRKAAASKLKAPATKATGKAAASKLKGGEKKAPAPKVEEDEDLKGLLLLEDDAQDQDVLALVQAAESDADLCALAQEADDEAKHAEWRLGALAYNIRKSKAFRRIEKGRYDVKGGFEKFCDEQLGTGYRKVMYLIETYQAFQFYGVESSLVQEVGWSKAKAIANAMTDENKDDLITAAREQSVKDLNATISENYSKKGADGREKVKFTNLKFRLAEDQGAVVSKYLEQAAQQLGTKDLNAAFAGIVTQWAAEHLNTAPVSKAATTVPVRRGAPAVTQAAKPAVARTARR